MSNEPIEYQNSENTDAVPAAEARAASAAPVGTGGDVGSAVSSVLRKPGFLIVAGALLIAAVGLNGAVNFMQLHFKKEAVSLSHPLGSIPARIGTWVQVSQDQPLDSETQDVLGTDVYIFREYVDERIVGAGQQDKIRSLRERSQNETDTEKRIAYEKDYKEFIPKLRSKFPNAVISLSVTYYTGMVDTVAHVPDRCVTADGYEPRTYDTVNWKIARDLPASMKASGDDIKVRYINFEDQTGTSNVPRSIAYFFHVNGEFACSPLDVRSKLAELWEKKAYYAKIETMTTMENSDESAKVITDFLTGAMPEIVRCMPDWDKEHGRAPRTQVAEK